jgi:hypothetical protein
MTFNVRIAVSREKIYLTLVGMKTVSNGLAAEEKLIRITLPTSCHCFLLFLPDKSVH